MSSPYRDADIQEVDLDDEVKPLATFVVDGRGGADGQHGHAGSDGITTGSDGSRGGDAGPASAGEGAGEIELELIGDDKSSSVRIEGRVTARDGTRDVRDLVMIDEAGTIELSAIGGDGGRGGNGGRGGDGQRGSNGSDATRWSSGSNGGNGGDGGNGGNATSGAPGGRGGRITITVRDDDTPLLMLVHHDVHGGKGGAAGTNGAGGSGGSGGSGGDSYSWTETEHYTDSNGQSQTRSHYHRNSGGSNGSSGSDGSSGNATVRKGAAGEAGTFQIRVKNGDAIETYDSRYDLRLVAFAHDSLNEDAVYEPNELVRVFDLEVENVGGMPTPKQDVLALTLEPGGWVKPEPGELQCAPGLAPGARYKVPGELRFRIKDILPAEPADPLEVEETILARAMLPSVKRAFAEYQTPEATEQGRFVIRFPLRASPVQSLKSLAAGEATRVRFTLTNQSRFALGAKSDCKRVIRVRVATAPDSEIGDEHATFVVDDGEVAPSTGWTKEISSLGAGESLDLELVVRFGKATPEYLRFAAHVTLELGQLDAPESPRAIQLRDFDIRVARPFAVSDADVLLVVNHRTKREVIEAWQNLADQLACNLAIWDLSREGHLDLERPLADGIPLGDWFAHKAIVVLDNPIDGPDGTTYPHVYLDEAQAARAAASGLDISMIGKGAALDRMLTPVGEATTTTVYRSFYVRWWAKPTEDWLEHQARKLSAKLGKEKPSERHLVIYRFAPEIDGKSAWMNRWRVGTLETLRTLDTAAGAVVHAAAEERELDDPAFVGGDHVRTALLVMFDFDENLERLRRLVARAGLTDEELAPVVDALVLDLANELLAINTPGWMGEDSTAELPLPRLDALARFATLVEYDSPAGRALRKVAARVLFLARSQVGWWENVPPFLWTRRGPATRARIKRAIDAFLDGAFGSEAEAARDDVEKLTDEQTGDHKRERKANLVGKRRLWAIEQARRPLAPETITSDTELMTTVDVRVMTGADYDAIVADKDADRARREKLLAASEQQHAALFVR